MKLNYLNILLVALLLAVPVQSLKAQDAAPAMPAYVTVTTLYWNTDNDEFSDWEATEKEYLEKVTKKNELILNAGLYMHLYTESSIELKYVQTYASWADVEAAAARNAELEKEAWPDDEARKAFIQKRTAYYSDFHSDEIYAPIPGAKPFTAPVTEDLVTYVRVSKAAFPADGTMEEFSALHKEYVENVIYKNDLIKAYFPNVHAWGSDRRDFLEAFYLSSLADLDEMATKNGELVRAHWPEDEARSAFFEKYNKYFTAEHGDYLYTYIADMSK